jgi:hypothetical protein
MNLQAHRGHDGSDESVAAISDEGRGSVVDQRQFAGE